MQITVPRSGRQLIVKLPATMRAGRPSRPDAAASQVSRDGGAGRQPASRPRGRSGPPPVAFGAELDVQRAQVLPPDIVQRRELVLAARVVQSWNSRAR